MTRKLASITEDVLKEKINRDEFKHNHLCLVWKAMQCGIKCLSLGIKILILYWGHKRNVYRPHYKMRGVYPITSEGLSVPLKRHDFGLETLRCMKVKEWEEHCAQRPEHCFEFAFPQPAVWSWTSHFIFLSLIFLLCTMRCYWTRWPVWSLLHLGFNSTQ